MTIRPIPRPNDSLRSAAPHGTSLYFVERCTSHGRRRDMGRCRRRCWDSSGFGGTNSDVKCVAPSFQPDSTLGHDWQTAWRSTPPEPATFGRKTEHVERLAMEAMMRHERSLGFETRDVSTDNVGYDIESRHPVTGRLRFVEVKGRAKGADTVTITRNGMTTALNSPDEWRLAIVDGEAQTPIYVAHPFTREPQFAETSANFNILRLTKFTESSRISDVGR